MTDKIYIVTEGAYEDYRIRKVFLSREAAQRYADLINRTTGEESNFMGADVEEFISCADNWNAKLYLYMGTTLCPDGSVLRSHTKTYVDHDEQYQGTPIPKVRQLGNRAWSINTEGPLLDITSEVHDEAVAKKRTEILGE